MAFDVGEYPPRIFAEKYRKFLAPQGILLSPQDVFKNKNLPPTAEDALRKAFKITMTKLVKKRNICAGCSQNSGKLPSCKICNAVRYCSSVCRAQREVTHAKVCDALRLELLDEIVECLPSPVTLGKEILRGRGGAVKDWDDWFTKHTCLYDSIESASRIVTQWWPLIGTPNPGPEDIHLSLRRIISGMFSTVLTIGMSPFWFGGFDDSRWPINTSKVHVHLLGADRPEVSAVESGLAQLCGRSLGRALRLTLVAPDLIHHPNVLNWTPSTPLQVSPNVEVAAYLGLYHDFWRLHVSGKENNIQVPQPHVALAIHPGVHTREMFSLWRPTLELLAKEKVPLVMTTYNEAEFSETMKILEELHPNVVFQGINPLRSLHAKQTPYEPDHMWAVNWYVIAIDNARDK
ncbi:putative protein MSS51 homolog, mitochondrial [Oratosquilla oratoria]|uniref:putative protein MSS51 homolog, mitochondrial n=1 Tax=Oratosquilla oratoria TaxID=337810 RepID=UPI003F75D1EA